MVKTLCDSLTWAIAASCRASLEERRATLTTIRTKATLAEVDCKQQHLHATYALLVRSVKSPAQGHLLQQQIKHDGLLNDPFLKSLLIQMYGKCGSVNDARLLFDSMPMRPMLAWKSIIRAYAQEGQCLEALQLFEQLLQEGLVPDKYSFVSILTACANLSSLASGERIHALVVGNMFVSDIAVGTALVNMYGKCDSLIHGTEIFEDMCERTVIVWNVQIAAHVKHNEGETALLLSKRMQQEGVLPNRITFINILSSCVVVCAGHYVGKRVHAIFWTHEFHADIAMGNAVINMYCKLGWLKDATLAFDGLLTQNIVSWTSMIEAYTQQGHVKEAFQFFERMKQQGGLPDKVTYIGILETCANLTALPEGKQVHACLVGMGIELNVVVGTAIVHMYGMCGSMERAGTMFDKMPQHNLISWTSMLALQSQHGEGKGTFQCFSQMLQEGLMPDNVVFFSVLDVCCRQMNLLEGKRVHSLLVGGGYEPDDHAGAALISLYFKCRSLVEAHRMFDSISELGVASWTAMIATCTEHGEDLEALQLFCQMQEEGVIPDETSLGVLLQACANLTSLLNGRKIHTYIKNRFMDATNNSIGASLVNMYGKCGNLKEAHATFNGVLKPNLISWTALVTAYVQHGESKKAFRIFNQLAGQGFRLDDTSFLQLLLACCRAGFVEEGYIFFYEMVENYAIKPGLDHYCCMVDLLGRAGHLEYAEALIHKLPCHPSAVLWMALLGACRHQLDVDRGECAGKHIVELTKERGGVYLVLSNIYAMVSRVDEQHYGSWPT